MTDEQRARKNAWTRQRYAADPEKWRTKKYAAQRAKAEDGCCVRCCHPLDPEILKMSRARKLRSPYCTACRKKQNKNAAKYRSGLRDSVLVALGGCCVECGFSDKRALQVDHIHGGGRADYIGKQPLKYMREILAGVGTGKYQLLCANCNVIKRIVMREHRKAPVWSAA